jgi:hypothetical protein
MVDLKGDFVVSIFLSCEMYLTSYGLISPYRYIQYTYM